MQVDEKGQIVLLNRVTEKMFGYRREELLGQRVEILVPAASRSSHGVRRDGYRQRPVTRTMGAGLALEGQRKDGTLFPVEISLSPSGSAQEFRVTAIIRDTTERKQAEDKLRAVREKYVEKLSEQNQELELRNREIEKANRLKSEFLASMSHELRTPLHTIIGFSELLAEELEGPLNQKQRRFVDHIHTDSLHLLELINDILDLSKIEAGRLDLRPEVFDFSGVLAESVNSIRTLADAKSLNLETEVELRTALTADRLRVKQILVNLLSNAVKFTPDEGSIRVHALESDGNLIVSVSDTGIGIAPDDLEAIFQEFHQAGVTTKGVREGTGLGLAITKHLIELHGGTISVESTPGEGSTFQMVLPMERP